MGREGGEGSKGDEVEKKEGGLEAVFKIEALI